MNKKSTILLLFAGLLMAGCGVGTYSHSSGKAEGSHIVFTSTECMPLEVTIDGQTYNVSTVKQKDYKVRRNIKATAKERIAISVGKHEVWVKDKQGAEIYHQTIFVSTDETKTIAL